MPCALFSNAMTSRLPIDDSLTELRLALNAHHAAVLQAPPGAGKTTRVPLALVDESWLAGKKIVMLEPRRLAATNAARWMSHSLGEQVGGTVGYAVRFDRCISEKTRIEVVTEGILTRRLQNDPDLSDIGLVIFDEFHERNLHSDLAFALCRDVQQVLRDDLKILVMSATIECEAVASLLDNAPIVTSAGRSFSVDVRYLEPAAGLNIPEQVAWGINRALVETEGDILAFLPGEPEIRRCGMLLRNTSVSSPGHQVLPLYANLPFVEQERALQSSRERKVVLATNIAETSLTIEGVKVVVDSGWNRRLRFDPGTGLDSLITTRISLASAEQRSGRAGRMSPGVCYRLWSKHVHLGLVPYNAPEIMNSDLSHLALELACWGISDPLNLSWLDVPPRAAFNEGRELLTKLGALDTSGQITVVGRRMVATGLHPRLARIIVQAQVDKSEPLACEVVALLESRNIFRVERDNPLFCKVDSDVAESLEVLHNVRASRQHSSSLSIDRDACAAVERTINFWRKRLKTEKIAGPIDGEELGRLLAVGWPDRVAQQRPHEPERYLLANGTGGKLSHRSALRSSPFIVALNLEGGNDSEALIHMASSISVDSVKKLFPDDIVNIRSVAWDDRSGRVVAREEERFETLVLSSRQAKPLQSEVLDALMTGLRSTGNLSLLNWTPRARRFLARVCLMASIFPEDSWPDLSADALFRNLEQWLGPYLVDVNSLSALKKVDVEQPLRSLLSWNLMKKLDEGAPEYLVVPSGSRITLDYQDDGQPVLSVKLQEMFGLVETPKVAFGRVPVLLHLLSPAQRPIQVTSDLRNFWDTIYPEVKKELKGRYPKHPWPDDPWHAVPMRGIKKRM